MVRFARLSLPVDWPEPLAVLDRRLRRALCRCRLSIRTLRLSIELQRRHILRHRHAAFITQHGLHVIIAEHSGIHGRFLCLITV